MWASCLFLNKFEGQNSHSIPSITLAGRLLGYDYERMMGSTSFQGLPSHGTVEKRTFSGLDDIAVPTDTPANTWQCVKIYESKEGRNVGTWVEHLQSGRINADDMKCFRKKRYFHGFRLPLIHFVWIYIKLNEQDCGRR